MGKHSAWQSDSYRNAALINELNPLLGKGEEGYGMQLVGQDGSTSL